MPRRRVLSPRPLPVMLTVGMTVALLYFAQEVLKPIALAVLLTFLLAPPTAWLERRRLKRVPAVLTLVTAATLLFVGLGWIVGTQIYDLATNLPQYRDNVVRKIERVRAGGSGGITSKVSNFFDDINRATNEPASRPSTQGLPEPGREVARDPAANAAREVVGGTPTTAPSTIGSTPGNPLYAVALPAPVSPVQTLATYLGVALTPLGNASLVLIFVIFMLLQREDLRDRAIRLVSGDSYTTTTKAIDDAAGRISRYILAQTIINFSTGAAVGIGLLVTSLIFGRGVIFPSFVLWGLLAGVLRFIPYLGPLLAAGFPLALSLAVYDSFHMFVAVGLLVIVVELISNNVLEPWLYGASTGLSTVAILVAAVFWTWLWGPFGLLLSTPLTVCIVVLGKYTPQLAFLNVMLGDQPALPASETYYQRVLAGDLLEASDVVKKYGAAHGPDALYDRVLMPALVLTRRDRARNNLTADEETSIFEAVQKTLRDAEVESLPNARVVIGVPSHHRLEQLTLEMVRLSVVGECDMRPMSTRNLPAEIEARIASESPAAVFISVLPPGGLVQARYLCRRFRKRFPDLPLIVGYFGRSKDFDRLLVKLRAAGASYVVTSVSQSQTQLRATLAQGKATDTVYTAAAMPQ